jgi:putative transposase
LTAGQKQEILHLVETSALSVHRTLKKLRVPRRTYYRWKDCLDLTDRPSAPRCVWNRLLDDEVVTVITRAVEYPDRSAREIAWQITDEGRFSVSESTVYRILKREGLMRELPVQLKAAREYHRKTERVHELWQTDFTYFHIINWGWYYAGGVLDDYSRYLICYQLSERMDQNAVQAMITQAVAHTGMEQVPIEQRVKLLTDNGSGFISKPFNEYLKQLKIPHIYAQRNHPQTNGKIERLNRTAKEKVTLVLYTSPKELEEALDQFRSWYNHEHYHEALGNLHPADVYTGRAEAIKKRRKALQTKTKKARQKANTKHPRTTGRNATYSPKLSIKRV